MYRVKDEYRKSGLSLQPGGYEVYVVYPSETRVYDKVKSPEAFANGVIKKCKKEGNVLPVRIEIKDKVLWENS
jgi:hypothetical protein